MERHPSASKWEPSVAAASAAAASTAASTAAAAAAAVHGLETIVVYEPLKGLGK